LSPAKRMNSWLWTRDWVNPHSLIRASLLIIFHCPEASREPLLFVRFPSQHSSPVGDWYADSLWQMRRGYLDLSRICLALLDISCGVNHLKMRPKAASSRVTATGLLSIDRQDRSTLEGVTPIRCSSAFQYSSPLDTVHPYHVLHCPVLIRSHLKEMKPLIPPVISV
jgi:hypothetical protein